MAKKTTKQVKPVEQAAVNHWPDYVRHWNGHALNHGPVRAVSGLGEQYEAVIGPVLTAVAPPTVERVYDIGCGAGLTYPIVKKLWPEADYTGLDISREMIDYCWEAYPDGGWVLVERPYLPPDKADLIICHSVLTHVYPEDAMAYLKEIAAHLSENGRASVSIHTDCDSGWAGDIGRIDYEPAYFEQMLADCGLEIVVQIPGNQLVYGVKAS